MDALTRTVREGRRIINVHALIAVGIDVASSEDGAGWLAFLRSLAARGLPGVQLVVSDLHTGPVNAIGTTLPGASRQRCHALPHALNGHGRCPHRPRC